jgi:hypothetical protein
MEQAVSASISTPVGPVQETEDVILMLPWGVGDVISDGEGDCEDDFEATKGRSGKDKRPPAPCLPIVQILSSSSQLLPPLLSRGL